MVGRVSDAQVFESARRAIGRARERLTSATDTVSSGQRVRRAADDPAAAAALVRARFDEARHGHRIETLGRTLDEVRVMDASLDAVQEGLTRAKELAVQMANASYDAGERVAAASEADGLLKTVVAALNAESGGRYLFGGTKTDAPPFDTTGAYSGDTLAREIEIAPGVRAKVSIRADTYFAGAGGGTSTLQNLIDLREALQANDVTALQGLVTRLDESLESLATARGEVGSIDATLDLSGRVARDLRLEARRSASAIGDADLAEAVTRMTQAQQALQAVYGATARSTSLSLLDKLG